MSIGADDELLQDFLIEAGEILDGLGGQLLDLERDPADSDLLNAIFRGFHTIKGGAGFLGLHPLVDVCHHAEDVFNQLRQGERQVDAGLMDVILAVVDALNVMFTTLRAGSEPDPADEALMSRLTALAAGEQVEVAPPPAAVDEADAEFEAMLEASAEPEVASASQESEADQSGAQSDEITDAEFEALLDQLHGEGKHSGQPEGEEPATPAASGGNEISEDEFEALLDQLHGAGAAPQGGSGQTADAPKPKADGKSEVKAKQDNSKPSAPARPESRPAPAAAPKAVQTPPAETTVRVDVERLDDIMNLVGELVLVRNRLVTLSTRTNDEAVSGAISSLELVTTDLQNAVMRTRMQPIKKVFGRFPRVVRDLARNMAKEVNLELRGEETELDKNLVEALADPLVHLVRNSVDHGIEMPDVRAQAGKPTTGELLLSAEQQGDHILLAIEDDGKGMDPDILRAKAVEKGLMDESSANRLSRAEVFDLIFQPGFSTKEQVSDISGRGVGMDVVKTRIAGLNGSIEIESEPGRGTVIRIRLPLTLAIVPTLMVKVGGRPFAIPLSSIGEILDFDLNHTKQVDNKEVIVVREKALPLVRLGRWLAPGVPERTRDGLGHVVVVHIGTKRVGYVVDDLLGQEEVVIKPLGPGLRQVPGYAGATITGDGHLALILDLPGIMRAHGLAA
ncbi:MAG: chemotaxis protein CheA [Acidihalobacter sp.]|uniref:chemotaxis protein CheA n=1 Tax=Acidihalobacter sp. TaxID=1872108 RepID=UPI00307E65DD